jgi:transcription elongation GreA/GreB family factor
MPDVAARKAVTRSPWPLTSEAWTRLIDEIARLRQEISGLTTQGLEEGIVRLPVALAARRLDTLKDVRDRAEVVEAPTACVIGRRVCVRDEAGEEMSFEVVFPGDGNTDEGCISADSPLGSALLRARAGDVVHVHAPAGAWSVTVVAVE